MSNITLHNTETAPEGSREFLGGVEQKLGFVPNVFRQMAEAPAALKGTLTLISLLEESSLSPEEQWTTLLVTASHYCANYCIAANSTIAKQTGVSEEIILAVRAGQPLADSKLEALRRLVTEMVQKQGATSSESIKRFMKAGYSKAQLFDVILAIGLETIASFSTLASETPIDEQFL